MGIVIDQLDAMSLSSSDSSSDHLKVLLLALIYHALQILHLHMKSADCVGTRWQRRMLPVPPASAPSKGHRSGQTLRLPHSERKYYYPHKLPPANLVSSARHRRTAQQSAKSSHSTIIVFLVLCPSRPRSRAATRWWFPNKWDPNIIQTPKYYNL